MIKKADLIHGQCYEVDGRGAMRARWNAERERFIYRTIDMGFTLVRARKHIEDEPDPRRDAFTPLHVIDPITPELPLDGGDEHG